ncbi:MAG: peptidylprolyl isomerase, partial [Deltaproteobacteria bacterium]|nr:peptidylprolyl isomerase [Deltaproteobacteria bacterium]
YEGMGPRRTLAGRIAEERVLCLAAHQRGETFAAVAARAAEEAVAARFVDQAEQAAVSEQSIADYYEAHPDKYRLEVIHVSHIIVGERQEAEAILRELRAGASFENLAMKHSVDSRSAEAGGRLGWIANGRMDPAWSKAAFAVETGSTSEAVRTAYGWALIRVDERKNTQPLDEVRAGIERRLRERAAQGLLGEVMPKAEMRFLGPLSGEAPGPTDPNP